MREIQTPLCDLYVRQTALDYDEMGEKIHKCKRKNMPEDFNEDLNVPFIIGDTLEELHYEYVLMPFESHRFCFRRDKTWCGQHPTYWRKMTQNEALAWTKFYINTVKNRKK